MRTLGSYSWLLVAALAVTGCPKGDDDKADGKDGKAGKDDGKADKDDGKAGDDEGEASLQVAEGDDNVDGPIPPDASMVLFSIEGSLMPLACFDKDAGTIKAGKDCLALVKEGDPVRLDAGFSNARNKAAGAPVEPQCMAGAGKKVAIGVEGISDANYKFATLPPSGVRAVKLVKDDTLGGAAVSVDDDTKAKLLAAIQKDRASAKGEVELHQVAEVDLDGNPKKDVFYAAYIKDPKVIEQYLWSGMLLAPDGDLDGLVLVEKSKSKKDVFEIRAAVNLDGAGGSEIWMRLVWAEGGGDRLYRFDGGKPKALGKWTCGA